MTNTLTNKAAEDLFGVKIHEYHTPELDIPVLTGLQAQGDIVVVPIAPLGAVTGTGDTKVPQTGVAVVRGENGGNTHLLLGAPTAFWAPSVSAGTDPSDLKLGTLTVPAGGTAYLTHPEHGFAGIGGGTYVINRQRQQADVQKFVED